MKVTKPFVRYASMFLFAFSWTTVSQLLRFFKHLLTDHLRPSRLPLPVCGPHLGRCCHERPWTVSAGFCTLGKFNAQVPNSVPVRMFPPRSSYRWLPVQLPNWPKSTSLGLFPGRAVQCLAPSRSLCTRVGWEPDTHSCITHGMRTGVKNTAALSEYLDSWQDRWNPQLSVPYFQKSGLPAFSRVVNSWWLFS